jgi:hypothetical protein
MYYDEYYLLGYDAVNSYRISPTFRRKFATHISKIKPSDNQYLMLVACLDCSRIVKMDLFYPSEASVNFYQNTRRHIRDDSTHRRHRYKNPKSNKLY